MFANDNQILTFFKSVNFNIKFFNYNNTDSCKLTSNKNLVYFQN